MKVLRGGSAEVKPNRWFKFDVELDESDLQAIVVKHSLDYPELTVGMKYTILAKQAEILTTVEMESQGLQGEESSRDLVQKFVFFLNSLPKTEN